MLEHTIGALRENEDWGKENKNGPLRKVVGALFGLGVTTVGRVGRAANRRGGVLVSAPRTDRSPRRQRALP